MNVGYLGRCQSCGAKVTTECDTNYNKTIYICKDCHYPNEKSKMEK